LTGRNIESQLKRLRLSVNRTEGLVTAAPPNPTAADASLSRGRAEVNEKAPVEMPQCGASQGVLTFKRVRVVEK